MPSNTDDGNKKLPYILYTYLPELLTEYNMSLF